MILKQRYAPGGWRYLDNVASVEDAGHVVSEELPRQGKRRAARVFQSEDQVRDFIDQVYGHSSQREFVEEWVPLFEPRDAPDSVLFGEGVFAAYSVKLITARLRDGKVALIVVGQETYLLADNGDTIERL